MYLARLREALASDYPALLHYLGDEAFTQLVAGYVQKLSVSKLYTESPGRSSAGIRPSQSADYARREFLYDLARLELAMSEVFDAPESPVLKPKAIANVSHRGLGGGSAETDRGLSTAGVSLSGQCLSAIISGQVASSHHSP